MRDKIGILCAGDREAAPFLAHIENITVTEKAMLKLYEGTIYNIPVVVLFSGVCKVNAAIAAQILIDHYGVSMILNAGTAGGMDPRLELFDTVIATQSVYHDVAANILTEFHPWMDSVFFPSDAELLRLSRLAAAKLDGQYPIYWGRIATGEAFIADDGRQEIIGRFSPLAVDMETAAIAHVCYVNRVPFLAIRCVTDTANHSGSGHFHENCPKASAIAKEITLALLHEIKARNESI